MTSTRNTFSSEITSSKAIGSCIIIIENKRTAAFQTCLSQHWIELNWNLSILRHAAVISQAVKLMDSRWTIFLFLTTSMSILLSNGFERFFSRGNVAALSHISTLPSAVICEAKTNDSNKPGSLWCKTCVRVLVHLWVDHTNVWIISDFTVFGSYLTKESPSRLSSLIPTSIYY